MIDSTSLMCDVRDIFSIINNSLPIILGTLYFNKYVELYIYTCIEKFLNCKFQKYFYCMYVTKIYFN